MFLKKYFSGTCAARQACFSDLVATRLKSIPSLNWRGEMAAYPSLLQTTLLGGLLLILVKLWERFQWRQKYKLPPGPTGIPFFGNMFQMPPYHQGPWAKDMTERYGEM